jgi:hypothetical protein
MQMINIEVILQYLAANWPIMFLRAEFKLFILYSYYGTEDVDSKGDEIGFRLTTSVNFELPTAVQLTSITSNL